MKKALNKILPWFYAAVAVTLFLTVVVALYFSFMSIIYIGLIILLVIIVSYLFQ